MQILQDIPLKNYNTFGIAVTAKYFCEVTTLKELKEALSLKDYPSKFILSGGSNMLLTKNINALVIYINLKGITVVKEDEKHVILKIMAGENWHNMVLWTLKNNYGGIENMSLIPGKVGTAPIQNIGAYGVELKDHFVKCQTINNATLEEHSFSKEDCKFGYRDSFFKQEGKGKHIITAVFLELTKKNHILNTSYGSIEEELKKENITNPTIQDVSNAVIAIRKSKLPDPKKIGNSGSFFKNPIISEKDFKEFSLKNPEAPFYKITEKEYKIPAGWLIEQSGFKGKRYGDAGVHTKQALVLVNYANATGEEIVQLASKIIKEVQIKFNITIVPEVNIIK